MTRFTGLHGLLLGVLGVLWLTAPVAAQTAVDPDDGTRSVRIIEEPPANAAPAAPEPSVQPPAVAAPPPAVPSQPSAAIAPKLKPERPSVLGPMKPPDLKTLQASLKARNPAGVSVQILPGPDLRVGEKIALRVTTRKQGYLVLVDLDASGKLTQVYPNRRSLLMAEEEQKTANLIKPGRTLTIPDVRNPYAGFELVAAPPVGVAMVIAILSDRPVQMLDLPEIPAGLAGQSGALTYLTDWTRNLRIVQANAPERFEVTTWSFDAKPYVIH